jgi:cell division protease FtsH
VNNEQTQQSSGTSRQSAAYHEAGHAVAAHFRPAAGGTRRITIRPAELDPGDAGLHIGGCSCPEATRLAPDDEWLRATAIVSLAGAEVDRHLTGGRLTCASEDCEDVRDLLFHAVFDWEIQDCADAVTLEERRSHALEDIAEQRAEAIEERYQALLARLRSEAHDLVEQRWPHVEAVAEALLERGALTGAEVEAIVEGVERRLRRPSGAERPTRARPATRRPPAVA